jgi:hypothetical protein
MLIAALNLLLCHPELVRPSENCHSRENGNPVSKINGLFTGFPPEFIPEFILNLVQGGNDKFIGF